MNFKKNIEKIDKLLIDINACKDINKFYELCSKLYYMINATVYCFEDKLLNMEEKEDVSDYRTNSD